MFIATYSTNEKVTKQTITTTVRVYITPARGKMPRPRETTPAVRELNPPLLAARHLQMVLPMAQAELQPPQAITTWVLQAELTAAFRESPDKNVSFVGITIPRGKL